MDKAVWCGRKMWSHPISIVRNMTNPFMGQLMVGEGTDEVAGLYTLAHSHSKSTLSLCTNENQPRKCSLFKIDFTKDKIKAQVCLVPQEYLFCCFAHVISFHRWKRMAFLEAMIQIWWTPFMVSQVPSCKLHAIAFYHPVSNFQQDGVMRGLILNSVESSDDYLCVKIDYNLRLEGTLKVPPFPYISIQLFPYN